MSKQIARKNHILPKKYLSRFAQNNRICVLDFETKKQNNLHIQEAAVIKDFYTVKTINSQKDDLIEQKVLSYIEGKCDPAITEVVNNHTFSKGNTWALLANYIALMYTRGPLFRQIILETYEQFDNKNLDELLDNEEMYYETMNKLMKERPDIKVLSFKEAKKVKDELEIEMFRDIPRTFYVVQMMNFAANLVYIIHKMTPNLLCAPKYFNAKFVTGDVPIIPIPRKPSTSSTWINNPDCDLYFPLSSCHCLVLNYDSLPKSNNVSSRRIAWINHLVACNCTRIVLSEEESFIWMRENGTISSDSNELVEAWGEEKKTRFRGAHIDKNHPPKCRNDWGYLRSKDSED